MLRTPLLLLIVQPKDDDPVPPFAIPSVPASVIAPLVAEDGVSPVVPALKDVTPEPPPQD